MTIEEIRNQFPYLKLGKIYLNHAALSPIPLPVIERANLFLKRRSETNIDDMSQWMADTEEAKAKLGFLLSANPDRFAFFDNTSTGLNVLAQGLAWKPGDRILLNDVEFPSNVYPFLNLKNQGVEIDFVHSKLGAVSSTDILAAVTPKTKLISLSAVQFLSGYRSNLKEIGQYCREHGIIFCVDAIQALGALSIDVVESKIDFLSCGTQKWLLGLMGLSFIYITEELQQEITPRFVGWASMDSEISLLDYSFVFKKTADALQNGTINMIGVNALIGALNMLIDFGKENIEQKIIDNTIFMVEELQAIGIKPVCSDYKVDNLSGIVSFSSSKSKMIYQKLNEKQISCSLREGFVRLSHHFYNTPEEILKAVAEINCCR